jgi:RecB family endonuclease NucS
LNNALRSLGFDVREVEKDLSEEPDAEGAEESETTTSSIERDLRNALRKEIEQLEQGLTITDVGKEKGVEFDRIDIIAEDKKGAAVVIELKAGEADYHAIGQVLAYMGDLTINTNVTRGTLVAGAFSQKAVAAARVVKNLRLKKYGFNFTFEEAGKS